MAATVGGRLKGFGVRGFSQEGMLKQVSPLRGLGGEIIPGLLLQVLSRDVPILCPYPPPLIGEAAGLSRSLLMEITGPWHGEALV